MKKLPASTSSEFTRDHVISNTYKLLSVSVVTHYFKHVVLLYKKAACN